MKISAWLYRHPLASLAVVALFAVVILALASQWREDEFQLASAQESFTPSKFDERLVALDKEAVDNAYRDQVERLIAIWFKDDAGQPARALNGVATARKRYIEMMVAIEKREANLGKLRGLNPNR